MFLWLFVLCHIWIRAFWFYNLNHETKLPTFWSKVSYERLNHPRKGSLNFKCTQSCSQFQHLNESVNKCVEAVKLTSPSRVTLDLPTSRNLITFHAALISFILPFGVLTIGLFSSLHLFSFDLLQQLSFRREHISFQSIAPPQNTYIIILFPLNPPLAWLWQSPNHCYHV